MTGTSRNRRAAALAAALCVAGAAAPATAAEEFATEYSIAFTGIPVARSSVRTTVADGALTLKANLSSAGLGAVFDSTKATATVRGRITDKGIVTTSYAMNYTSGKRQRLTEVTFKGGNVTGTSITPPRRPRADAVPVEAGHLKNVVDPFLAGMIAARSPAEVCARTLRVFDGITRMDLVLRNAGTEQVSTGGYEGEAIRCSVRYVPVSGHRPETRTVKYMTGGERASISFAPVPGTAFYAPVKASIKTQAGTVSIKATRFEKVSG